MGKVEPRWQAGVPTTAALGLAVELFASKARKGSDTPYLSHLLAVSALVMEHGGTEVQAAAGLLHDVIEDTTLDAVALADRLRAAGVNHADAQQVADIVKASTDGKFGEPRDRTSWRQRKDEYLTRLRAKDSADPALLVSLADKVHNSESTVQAMRSGTTSTDFYAQPGFNAPAPAQKWYYSSLARVFREKLGGNAVALPLVQRLESAVDDIFSGLTADPAV